MRIRSIPPVKTPAEIQMTFPRNEGWDIIMALEDAVKKHPNAWGVEKWKKWAIALREELNK